jgi:hypothetical protein
MFRVLTSTLLSLPSPKTRKPHSSAPAPPARPRTSPRLSSALPPSSPARGAPLPLPAPRPSSSPATVFEPAPGLSKDKGKGKVPVPEEKKEQDEDKDDKEVKKDDSDDKGKGKEDITPTQTPSTGSSSAPGKMSYAQMLGSRSKVYRGGGMRLSGLAVDNASKKSRSVENAKLSVLYTPRTGGSPCTITHGLLSLSGTCHAVRQRSG